MAAIAAAAAFASGGIAIPIIAGGAAALGIGGGVTTTVTGGVQLVTSGSRTAEEDARLNAGLALIPTSFPTLAFGAIGGIIDGEEGMRTGLRYGSYADLGLAFVSFLNSGRTLVLREVQFGRSVGSSTKMGRGSAQRMWRAYGEPDGAPERFNLMLHGGTKEAPILFAGRTEQMILSHSFVTQRGSRFLGRFFGEARVRAVFDRPWNVKPQWRSMEEALDPGAGVSRLVRSGSLRCGLFNNHGVKALGV